MTQKPSLLSNIRGDLFGGITAGIVALPLALAFGVEAFFELMEHDINIAQETLSPLGAKAGLYGAIAIAIFAALFGGTQTQISGPTAPMTVVSAGVIVAAFKTVEGATTGGSLTEEEIIGQAFPIMIAAFGLAGLLQIVMGALRLGQYIRYVPHSVVSGFMSGIGFIIIFQQIFPLFGAASPEGGAWGTITQIGTLPGNINFYSFALSAATVAIIYLFPYLTRVVPSTLIALVAITTAAAFLIPADTGVRFIGDIPTGLPKPLIKEATSFPWSNYGLIIMPAITLAILGSLDSLLTSLVADNRTKTRHNSNQELVGQGIGNTVSALFGGLPGAGATMRTVVNINAGGKTRLSGVISGVILLVALLGLGQFVGMIPRPVLSGILLTVGIGIIDYRGLRFITRMPRVDAVVLIAVLSLTVFWDLINAVGVGMVFASLAFMKNMSDQVEQQSRAESFRQFSKGRTSVDLSSLPDSLIENVYIKYLDGPMFFGFASRFQEMIKGLPEVDTVVIRMENVPYIDYSGLYAFEDGLRVLHDREIKVYLAGLRRQPRSMFERLDIIPDMIAPDHIYPNFQECIDDLKAKNKKA